MWRNLWFRDEIEGTIRQTIRRGMVRYNSQTGKLEPRDMQGNYDSNWIFFSNTTDRRDCYLYHTIFYNVFGLVPEFCRFRCWKVVTKPRNVRELIQFYQLMLAMPLTYGFINPLHGKCGIDTRSYTKDPYDGFIYTDSKEECYEKYKLVRDALDKYLDPAIPAVMKRACTEFERDKGPTDGPFWQEMSKEDMELERYLSTIYAGYPEGTFQPDWHKNKIVLHWLKFAYMQGDMTGVEYLGEDIFGKSPVTYHDEMLQAETDELKELLKKEKAELTRLKAKQ